MNFHVCLQVANFGCNPFYVFGFVVLPVLNNANVVDDALFLRIEAV